MLSFHAHLKVFVATAPCDLRLSFNLETSVCEIAECGKGLVTCGMPLQIAPIPAHLSGETYLPTPSATQPLPDHLLLDTCGGLVRVEWDPQAPVTPLGQLVFFTQFLETSGRFDLWVKDCPWTYTSPNAPPCATSAAPCC